MSIIIAVHGGYIYVSCEALGVVIEGELQVINLSALIMTPAAFDELIDPTGRVRFG